jgi:tetratricopeptide (TPR) repeat protein
MRIIAQLVDTSTGQQIWAERYDRPTYDLWVPLEEVRRKIIVHLGLTLTDTDRWVVDREYTGNPEAFDAFWQGWESYNRFTQEDNTTARQLFERAVALDPMYAPAYMSLGLTYWAEWTWQWSQDRQTLERAFQCAQRAKALDGSLASARMLLAWVSVWKGQHAQAVAEGRQAVALDPKGAQTHAGLAGILNFVGKPEEAIGWGKRAMQLDPQVVNLPTFELSRAYYLLQRHEEAMAACQKLLAHSPRLLAPHLLLAALYSELGWKTQARAEVDAVREISPRFSLEVWRSISPYRDPSVTTRLLNALSKVGLK